MEIIMEMSCPDEERLVDYCEGRLSEEERSQLEAHLSECTDCLEAFVVAKNMRADMNRFGLESVPKSVTEAAVKLVLRQRAESPGIVERLGRSVKEMSSRLTDTLRGPWGTLQPVAVRGPETREAEDVVRHRVSLEGIEMEIEVEKAGDDRAHIRVKTAKARRRHKGIRVTLKKGDKEIASYRLEGAYVLFEDIPFGHYGISLAEDGAHLGTYHFEIKDTREEG